MIVFLTCVNYRPVQYLEVSRKANDPALAIEPGLFAAEKTRIYFTDGKIQHVKEPRTYHIIVQDATSVEEAEKIAASYFGISQQEIGRGMDFQIILSREATVEDVISVWQVGFRLNQTKGILL